MALDHLESIRQMKGRKPFMPFRIVASNGERLEVMDFFQFAVGPKRVLYYYPKSNRFIELTAEQVVALEPIEKQSAA